MEERLIAIVATTLQMPTSALTPETEQAIWKRGTRSPI